MVECERLQLVSLGFRLTLKARAYLGREALGAISAVAESVLRALAGGGNGYRKAPPTGGIRKRTVAVAPESANFPITR
jgi:hypothetical protein